MSEDPWAADPGMVLMRAEARAWRVGTHYGIHVYEGDRPVATFHNPQEAAEAVAAVNAARGLEE